MTQRQIVGPGGGDFFVVEDPGRAQRIGPGLRRFVMPAGHRHLGSRVAWFLETPGGADRNAGLPLPKEPASASPAMPVYVRRPSWHNRCCAAKIR